MALRQYPGRSRRKAFLRELCSLLCLGSLLLSTSLVAQADPVGQAVANPQRPAGDLARDIRDQPGALLRFFQVQPGMVVLDLFAGGGYWTELLNTAVGPDGTVLFHNNQAYLNFLEGAPARRVAGNRLANVRVHNREHHNLELAPASIDLALMSMSYHDFWFKADGWDVSPDQVMPQVHQALKPGGLLAVLDHAAKPGTGNTDAGTLHRIDEAYLREDLGKRGFTLVGSTDLLRRSDDDHSINVFDPAIRGKTDRFVLLFRRD